MIVTHELTLDLIKCGIQPPVCVMQDDSNTRQLKLKLLAASAPWQPGDGITASVAYKKPDGTKGWYDTLPDGQAACVIEKNLVAATLAPQMLTVSGNVTAAVVFMDADLNRIATFPFCIQVLADPAAGETVSNDYYNYSTMEDINAQFASLEAELFTTSTRLSQLDDSASIVCDAAGGQISLTDASSRELQGLTLYGKTTQNGTPTPETPVPLESAGAGGSIGVTVAGKNLLPPRSTSNGNFTADGSGGYTSTAASGTIVIGEVTLEAGKTYTLSASAANEVIKPCILVRKPDGTTNLKNNYSNPSVPVTYISPETQTVKILLQTTSAKGRCPSGETFYIQLEIGFTATAYEPYKELQTLTTSTPNGLPGIPVSSGGNYTDENGQQWICDEIDFARGVYVRRVGTAVFNGSSGEAWRKQYEGIFFANFNNMKKLPGASVLCDCYTGTCVRYNEMADKHITPYQDTNNAYPKENWIYLRDDAYVDANALISALSAKPITVMYALTAPIETALSAEELASFAALHTVKPNTTVYNDSGAEMKLSYVADTKTYIDNKFNELAAAIVNNT